METSVFGVGWFISFFFLFLFLFLFSSFFFLYERKRPQLVEIEAVGECLFEYKTRFIC